MDTYLYIREQTDQIVICIFKYPLCWWLLLFSFTFSKQHAKVWITYFCFIIIILHYFLSLYSQQGKNMFWLKTNFKSKFRKKHDCELELQSCELQKCGEKLMRPPPPFHINMQRRPTGTIPVVCAGFKKDHTGPKGPGTRCV